MQKGIENFVKEYYRLLDSSTDVGKLQNFFDKEFEIIEGKLIINTFDKYSNWYEDVRRLYIEKSHKINSLDIKKANGIYNIYIDMDFQAKTFDKKTVQIENVNIHWQIVKIDKCFKIKRYEINI